ncbi:hypothetical protein CB1_001118028 [Camelus ferus]|nr:hypothetical protein CB1_001118028 [Camelus ferus]
MLGGQTGSLGPPAATPSFRPEDELEHLTKKMLYDMENPPADEYFAILGTVDPTSYYPGISHALHLWSQVVWGFCCFHFFSGRPRKYDPGRCARCGENVVGEGTGCTAMDQVFHVDCFTCIICNNKLRGQPFYAVEKKAYCEPCYIVSSDVVPGYWTKTASVTPDQM